MLAMIPIEPLGTSFARIPFFISGIILLALTLRPAGEIIIKTNVSRVPSSDRYDRFGISLSDLDIAPSINHVSASISQDHPPNRT